MCKNCQVKSTNSGLGLNVFQSCYFSLCTLCTLSRPFMRKMFKQKNCCKSQHVFQSGQLKFFLAPAPLAFRGTFLSQLNTNIFLIKLEKCIKREIIVGNSRQTEKSLPLLNKQILTRYEEEKFFRIMWKTWKKRQNTVNAQWFQRGILPEKWMAAIELQIQWSLLSKERDERCIEKWLCE